MLPKYTAVLYQKKNKIKKEKTTRLRSMRSSVWFVGGQDKTLTSIFNYETWSGNGDGFFFSKEQTHFFQEIEL